MSQQQLGIEKMFAFHTRKDPRLALGKFGLASVFVLAGTMAVQAQTAAPAAAPVTALPPPPVAAQPAGGATSSTVVNLIQELVQEGVLTRDRAQALIHQAQDEAAAQARTAPEATPVSSAATPPAPSVRVPYIPQVVRNQLREEVKNEVLKEAREQNWAAPNEVPKWTKRFHMNGDLRLRYEWDLFDSRNNNTLACPPTGPRCSQFANIAALNAGAPFDLANTAGTVAPVLDTTEDRQRMRIRARLGIDVDVADDLVAGFRLATGNTTNPVTTNQTLGTTLNKQNFLLDRAFLDYRPAEWVEVWLGRFANPWLNTDLVWDDDINFDGVAARFRGNLTKDLSLFATGGAFPIENTAFNFPDNTVVKGQSRDKWLFAGQLGTDWQAGRNFNFKLGAAYYHYQNLEGVLSSPCVPNSSADSCSTDNSRPGFQQNGNTFFPIRNVVTGLLANQATPPLFQYFGLSSPFHDLDFVMRADYDMGKTHVVLDGDFVKNLAFHRNRIAGTGPINNLTGAAPGRFDGGDMGYQARLTVGYPEVRERWQWNTSIAFKHLDSDAVPDAFTDSDFHLGGTNAEGYVFGATLGVAHNVDLTARWLSAKEVTSLPYTVDVALVDLNARF